MRNFCSGVVLAKTISSYLQRLSQDSESRPIMSCPLKTIAFVDSEFVMAFVFSGNPRSVDSWGDDGLVRAEISLTLSGRWLMMPHSAAIAWAVNFASPVTMKT